MGMTTAHQLQLELDVDQAAGETFAAFLDRIATDPTTISRSSRMPVTKSIHHRQAAAARALLQAVYQNVRWSGRNGTRAIVLERDGYTCRRCGAPATIADHWPVPLRTLLRRGEDPFDPNACRALCDRCSGHVDGGRS
jgi:hypothetical protein